VIRLNWATLGGEVEVVLHKADGSVSYRKHGFTQTWFDARGRNRADFIDEAVELLLSNAPKRVLVLGYGGGAATGLLDRAGVEVVSVDRDPAAERLARLFFRAPPDRRVVVQDAARFVEQAPRAWFDGALVDFQESPAAPEAYFSAGFWRALGWALRPGGLMVLNVAEQLREEPTWTAVRTALQAGGFDSVAVSDAYASGNRLLVSCFGPSSETGRSHEQSAS
jgi:spermidine synthase